MKTPSRRTRQKATQLPPTNGATPKQDDRPTAMELATLAAIISPSANGVALTAAMTRAIEFYVEAEQFRGELPTEMAELVKRFGSEHRHTDDATDGRDAAAFEALWRDRFTLEEALRITQDQLGIKSPRGLFEVITRYWNRPMAARDHRESAETLVIEMQTSRRVPRFILNAAVEFELKRRREQAAQRKAAGRMREQP